MLLAMAENLWERSELYVSKSDAADLAAVAAKLHDVATNLGPDPLGIGEGVDRG